MNIGSGVDISGENKILEQYRALVVESDPEQMRSWITRLNKVGVDVVACVDFDDAKAQFKQETIHFIIANRRLLKANASKEGIAAFLKSVSGNIHPAILLVYPADKQGSALKKTKIFAEFDLPISSKSFHQLINRVKARLSELSGALVMDEPLVKLLQPFLIFRSKLMREGLALLPEISQTPYNVLITGETGTGKEMVARAIHSLSPNYKGKFITVNCGAIPESLIESELFGHEKGSFTGAEQKRIGKFEEAHLGTLFLDEIGEMPLMMQVRLLRALEERTISRIGSNQKIPANPRIIAATQVDLAKAVANRQFREDLYYRLNILYIHLPPLSDRKDDIPLLVVYFLRQALGEIDYPKPYPTLSEEVIALLQSYHWPGNVRELKNFVIRVAATMPKRILVIKTKHIDQWLNALRASAVLGGSEDLSQHKLKGHNEEHSRGVFIPWGTTIKEAKAMLIDYALGQTGHNLTKAAKTLDMSHRHLSRLVNKKK